MKTFKLILAAMLLSVLSLATPNVTNAQTNSSIAQQSTVQGDQQVTGSGSPYLAAVNLDDNAHRNTTKAKKPTSVTLSYVDNLPGGVGHLLYVEFKQNNVTVYTFQNYQINGATVPQGTYTIVFHISNPLKYLTYSTTAVPNGNVAGCLNYYEDTYLVQSLYNFNIGNSTTLTFYSNTFNCSSGGGNP